MQDSRCGKPTCPRHNLQFIIQVCSVILVRHICNKENPGPQLGTTLLYGRGARGVISKRKRQLKLCCGRSTLRLQQHTLLQKRD